MLDNKRIQQLGIYTLYRCVMHTFCTWLCYVTVNNNPISIYIVYKYHRIYERIKRSNVDTPHDIGHSTALQKLIQTKNKETNKALYYSPFVLEFRRITNQKGQLSGKFVYFVNSLLRACWFILLTLRVRLHEINCAKLNRSDFPNILNVFLRCS